MTLRSVLGLTAGFAAVVAVTLLSGTVFAAEEKSPMKIEPDLKELQRAPGQLEDTKEMFDLFDDNGDGVIDSGEWRSQKMLVFYGRDANQDYRLSRDELPGISDELLLPPTRTAMGTFPPMNSIRPSSPNLSTWTPTVPGPSPTKNS